MLCPLPQEEQLAVDTGPLHWLLPVSLNCKAQVAPLQHKLCQNSTFFFFLILFCNLNSSFPFQLYLLSYFLITSVQKYFCPAVHLHCAALSWAQPINLSA